VELAKMIFLIKLAYHFLKNLFIKPKNDNTSIIEALNTLNDTLKSIDKRLYRIEVISTRTTKLLAISLPIKERDLIISHIQNGTTPMNIFSNDKDVDDIAEESKS
jgi:hypothetical protein